jgi:signal transduction histidine kinase
MAHSERKIRGVRFYLIALILLAVVPLLVISGVLIVRQSAIQREAFARTLTQGALALSVAVDRQLDTYRVMLETLAESDELRANRIDDFHALAERVAQRHGAVFISFFDRDGKQIFNTLRPTSAPLPTPFDDPRVAPADADRPPVGDTHSLEYVLKSGRPYVSDLFRGLVAGREIFTVNVPVSRDGKVLYVLNAAFGPGAMTRLLRDNVQFSGVPAVIFDRRGFIVGRWKDAERYVGQRIADYANRPPNEASGVGEGRMLDGLDLYYAHARSPATGWGVNIGIDRKTYERSLYGDWALGAALELAGLAVGLLLALWLATRLRESIAGLAEAASRNQAPKVKGLVTREVALLEQALSAAAAAREAEARERENRLIAEARKAEAEEASRTKDRFIAVLSHELRNPLAPIRNSVFLLRARAAMTSDPKLEEIVGMLDRQSTHLTRLVNDLLDVSRISSGRIVLQRAHIDLRDVARHATEEAMPALDARGHQLISTLPDEPVMVAADFVRLSQVVSNLLDNAIKYTPRGGRVAIEVERAGPEALLSVEDHGRGLEAFAAADLYTPFVAPLDAAARADGGLGLGLPLAKSLVELHGGSLRAYSEGANRGSRFTVTLPLADAARGVPDEQVASARGERAQKPRRVLVVDDNIDAARMLGMVLESQGHETAVEHDGWAALRRAEGFGPDVVILDIGMPGLDGYEVARRLRRQGGRTDLRIVALTGWGQQSDRERSRAAGIDAHLVKPIDPAALARLVNG